MRLTASAMLYRGEEIHFLQLAGKAANQAGFQGHHPGVNGDWGIANVQNTVSLLRRQVEALVNMPLTENWKLKSLELTPTERSRFLNKKAYELVDELAGCQVNASTLIECVFMSAMTVAESQAQQDVLVKMFMLYA